MKYVASWSIDSKESSTETVRVFWSLRRTTPVTDSLAGKESLYRPTISPEIHIKKG